MLLSPISFPRRGKILTLYPFDQDSEYLASIISYPTRNQNLTVSVELIIESLNLDFFVKFFKTV